MANGTASQAAGRKSRPRRAKETAPTLRDRLLVAKREEILRVVAEMFYENGYTQTSMDDIAARLGIGKPSIYALFESKAELLAEVCNRTTEYAASVAHEAATRGGLPSERLRYIVEQLCLRVIDGRRHLSVLFRDHKHLPAGAVKKLAGNFHAFNRSLGALLREGVEAGEFAVQDPVVVTHAISGMGTWIYAWYRPEGDLSAEDISVQMADLALKMVARGDVAGSGEEVGATDVGRNRGPY
ncbi:MAG: TetR/AcrR family transcriptional regulator [Burkholderiaceae bacterium]|nr:TetR/AcrR family transcriptional regulator [Burkholderiaceae bacterium]